MANSENTPVRSIHRALTILKTFSSECTEMSLGQISAAVDLPKSTVHRTLTSLQMENFIEQDEETGKYRLSYELMRLGVAASEGLDIRKIAMPEMERLSQRTQQTSNLYIIRDHARLCIGQVPGPHYTNRHSYVGAIHPLYCGSAGRVLMAFMEDDWIDEYLDNVELEHLTENTLTTKEAVWEAIWRTRREGFAATAGERETYSASVSVPIRDFSNKLLAAITVTGPLATFTEEAVASYKEALFHSSRQISSRYGYNKNLL